MHVQEKKAFNKLPKCSFQPLGSGSGQQQTQLEYWILVSFCLPRIRINGQHRPADIYTKYTSMELEQE